MSMLSNGLSGLNASQLALNVVSNNIANANVKGFSRQQANFQSVGGVATDRLSYGNGVEVGSINRITDDYLNNNIWRANASAGFYKSVSDYLVTTEQLLANENLSAGKGINDLFNAFDFASSEPAAAAPRQQVLASADAMVRRVNALASNLDIQQNQLNEQVNGLIAHANTLLNEVAHLNGKITEAVAVGGNTSALEDQRDEAIKGLAELMAVEVSRQKDGSMIVSMQMGQPLVIGGEAAALKDGGTGFELELAGQTFGFSSDIGGKIGGALHYQNTTLAETEVALNQLAQDVADQINNQLSAGHDLNGNPGKPLFTYDPADPASSLRVSDNFEPEDLAFAAPGAGIGDNSNLVIISQFKEGYIDSYNSLVGKLAIESAQAQAETQASAAIASEALSSRDAVSGVNLDEEAMNLIKYQQSYQANAKVITAADKLFSTLLNIY